MDEGQGSVIDSIIVRLFLPVIQNTVNKNYRLRSYNEGSPELCIIAVLTVFVNKYPSGLSIS